ncbi:uncharacterized protein [Typha latifolia]|uniref:uncharacterized protein isoform X1 n=1 Tax=Typha latifolia TaxID=4733 RepID=UPI003C2E745A
MAAAEARTAWQRTANRCLVQEDAKRAPKLACCSSSSVLQNDTASSNAANAQDHPITSFMPLNWNSANSNLPPDTKWWLQLQPNFGYPKDFICEQLDFFEDEIDEKKVENAVPTSNFTGKIAQGEFLDNGSRKSEHTYESPCIVSTDKHGSETRMEEMRTATNHSLQMSKNRGMMGDYYYHDRELKDWKTSDPLIQKKPTKAYPDMEIPWGGCDKCELWWRIADEDELASLVAQKSLQHIENCDLPRPTQTVHAPRDMLTGLETFENRGLLSSCLSKKLHPGLCDPIDYVHNNLNSGSVDEKNWSSGGGGLQYDKDKLHSGTHGQVKTGNEPPESKLTYESDSGRAQLLEALCHSQTRAREAEIAAKKAYDEKDHIVKLLFRQASHLFAYKQWLKMLQLESLCLQLKIEDQQIVSLFPILPWMPLKEKPSSKDRNNTMRSKSSKKQRRSCICKYVVFFAGLGLAGAGLLLGWSLGWLLPK